MQVHRGYENLNFRNPVVTLGIFDGVHLGHKTVIEALLRRAGEINGESVIISFYPHPRQILSGNDEKLSFLTSLEEKIELLQKTGVDHLVIIGFDRDFSNRTACNFVEEVLIESIRTKDIIVGFNNHFGKRGEGNFETIRKCAEEHYFHLEQVRALGSGNVVISSSVIRNYLLDGDLDRANSMLGYSYFLRGTVIKGKKLGRAIGYPTANIKPDYEYKLIPKDGVYAVELHLKETIYKGVLSIGLNPTVNSGSDPRTIEVNIFGFEEEVYGERLCIIFRFRLRDEIYFDTLAELADQIEADRREAIRLLD
jgi:riboflavin kinase/FMN adenylyltransferase